MMMIWSMYQNEFHTRRELMNELASELSNKGGNA